MYSFRNDSRKGAERSRQAWEFRALSHLGGANYDILPWYQGFVQHHGQDKADAWLKQRTVLSSSEQKEKQQRNDEWSFLFEDEFLDKNNRQQYDSKYGQFLRNRTAANHSSSLPSP